MDHKEKEYYSVNSNTVSLKNLSQFTISSHEVPSNLHQLIVFENKETNNGSKSSIKYFLIKKQKRFSLINKRELEEENENSINRGNHIESEFYSWNAKSNSMNDCEFKKGRKNDKDSIRKKIKGKFHKWLHLKLKELMNNQYDFSKLPQKECITNVAVKFNKKILDQTIYEIYRQFTTFPELKTLKCYAKKFDYEALFLFLNRTFKDCYNEYMKTHEDEQSKKIIGDIEYHNKYYSIARKFISYYSKKNPNKSKNSES